jgi:beta-N-acetylhexosaminidase
VKGKFSPHLERELGQLFMISLDREGAKRYEAEIRGGLIGGCLLRRDYFTASQASVFSKKMQSWVSKSGFPFLIAVDHEGGPMFTQRRYGASFPGNMALGAARNRQWTENAAFAAAQELRSLGINIDFAPVLDVNINPNNPIIGIRAFGENSHQVAGHARAAVRGYLRAGVIPVPKHFPGHGNTDVDSHSGLPVIKKSLPRMLRDELLPFQAAILAGAPLIMSAHILFSRLDSKNPATFSKKIINGLLRKRLGFKGVVISDALDMGAISKKFDIGEACVLALEGGCDILLIGTADFKSAYRCVLAAVRSGRLSESRVNEAFLRINTLKNKILKNNRARLILTRSQKKQHRGLAKCIAEKSITLLRDEKALLPLKLKRKENLLFISFRPKQFKSELKIFASQLRHRHFQSCSLEIDADSLSIPADRILRLATRADFLIIGTFSWGKLPQKSQIILVKNLLKLKKRAIVLSMMNPYDLRHYQEAETVLCCYGMTFPALQAAARAIFGEIIPRGKLPVTIPNTFSKGAGLLRFRTRNAMI